MVSARLLAVQTHEHFTTIFPGLLSGLVALSSKSRFLPANLVRRLPFFFALFQLLFLLFLYAFRLSI